MTPDEPGVDEVISVPTAEQMRTLGRRLSRPVASR